MIDYKQKEVTESILLEALRHIEHKHRDSIALILDQPMPFAGTITMRHLATSAPDPNPDNPTLRILLESVYIGCSRVLAGGGQQPQSLTLEESFVRSLCMRLYGRVRLLPHRDSDGTVEFRPFTLHPTTCPHPDSFVTLVNTEFQQLCMNFNSLCARRYEQLWEFYFGHSDSKRMFFMPHVERCIRDIHTVRSEINAYAANFGLHNPLVMLERLERDTVFQDAVGFDLEEVQRRELLDEHFALTKRERALLDYFASRQEYAVYDIRQTDPEFFHFSFSSSQEFEEYGYSSEEVLRHEQERLYQVVLERTMLIGFYTYCTIEREILSAERLEGVPQLREHLLQINKKVKALREKMLQ